MEISTDPALKARAAEAWKLMTRKRCPIFDTMIGREPLPPNVALDMVMHDDTERDDAITALIGAAIDDLQAKEPRDTAGLKEMTLGVYDHMRGEVFGLAMIYAGQLSFRAQDVGVSTLAGVYGPRGTPEQPNPNRPDVSDCDQWRQWAQLADEAIRWCEKVIEAGYPT